MAVKSDKQVRAALVVAEAKGQNPLRDVSEQYNWACAEYRAVMDGSEGGAQGLRDRVTNMRFHLDRLEALL
jgi:hypothetical protein